MVREIGKSELEKLLELYLFLHETSVPEMTEHLQKTWNTITEDKNHHIIIKEMDGRTDVYFDKPKYATDEQKQKLKDISPLIKCEFNKFKHYGLKNSLEINDRNIASVYDDINPYRAASNETEARLFERIQRSIRINNQLSSKRPRVDPLLKYLMPEH